MKVAIVCGGRFHSGQTVRAAVDYGCLESFIGDRRRDYLPPGIPARFMTPLAVARFLSFSTPGVRSVFPSSLVWDGAMDSVAAHLLPDRFDILHGFAAYSVHSSHVAAARGVPFVLDTGASHILEQRDLLQRASDEAGVRVTMMHPRWVARQVKEADSADHIVVGSEFARRSYLARGARSENVSVVGYGVESSIFAPADEVPREGILYVGNVSVMKGIHYLKAMLEELGLAPNDVTLIGRVSPDAMPIWHDLRHMVTHIENMAPADLSKYMQRARCLVLPSVQDGFGMVVTEALACGTPVVTTSNVGAADYILNGVNGFVVEPFSGSALALAVRRILNDDVFARTLEHGARLTRLRSWDDYARDLHAVWTSLVKE